MRAGRIILLSLLFLFLSVFCLAATGCAGVPAEPRVRTKTVEVPVRSPCITKDVPEAPSAYADDQLPTGPENAAERYKRTAAANLQRKARLAVLEPAVKACR